MAEKGNTNENYAVHIYVFEAQNLIFQKVHSLVIIISTSNLVSPSAPK